MRYTTRSVQILFLLYLGWCAPVFSDEQTPLEFGVFPFLPPAQLEDLFVPVAIDLSRAIGRPVQFRTRPSFAEFDEEVAQQTYDLVYVQPFAYARLAHRNGYEAIARKKSLISAIFITTENSNIRTIGDLSGKVLATPPPSAAVTLLGVQLLLDNRLQPGKNIRLDNQGSHFSCIRRVMIGKADACVTAKQPLKVFERKSGTKLRVIAESRAIPASTFAIHRRVKPEVRDKLVERILGWRDQEEGKRILKNLHHTYHIPSHDQDYDVVRDILDEIKNTAPADGPDKHTP